jgi:hypothetical protein
MQLAWKQRCISIYTYCGRYNTTAAVCVYRFQWIINTTSLIKDLRGAKNRYLYTSQTSVILYALADNPMVTN